MEVTCAQDQIFRCMTQKKKEQRPDNRSILQTLISFKNQPLFNSFSNANHMY